jgi:cation diffusion facilitator family transporter
MTAQATHTPEQLQARERIRAVCICMGASFLVCAVELTLGWLLQLQSLLAEGAHTFLDGLDSVVVLFAVLLAAKPADRSHQFGHGKFEAVGAAIEGSFILAAAIGIAYAAVQRLIAGQTPPAIPLYVCVTMGAASIFYFAISMYLMRIARQTKSPAVLAEAMHLRTHIYITAGLMGGLLFGGLLNMPVMDTLLALGVAVCLVAISIHIFREIFGQFTDAALPRDEIFELRAIIEEFGDRFEEVHGLRTRRSGAERHIEMHLVVMPDVTVADAHELSHEIVQAISDKWPTTRTTVHIEPVNSTHERYDSWMRGQPKVRIEDSSPDDREFIH